MKTANEHVENVEEEKRRGEEDGVSCESTRVVFLADFADKIEEYSVPSFEHV